MRNVVAWLDQRINEYGGTLSVVYLPAVRHFGYVDWPECEQDLVVETTKELNVPLIDVIPVMNESDDSKKFFSRNPNDPSLEGHPSREGYQLIGMQIVEGLKQQAQGR